MAATTAFSAIGAAGSAVSAGSGLLSMFGGDSSNEAAEAAAEQKAQASNINLIRLVLENQRKQNEIAMERDWSAFEYEDAAQWTEAWTDVDVAYAKTAANLQKQTLYADAAGTLEGNAVSMGNAVDLAVTMASGIREDALKKADLTNMLARAKATAATSEGESTIRDTQRERDYALDTLDQETRASQGELRASIAARGQAETGSALDVLRAGQDVSLKKQKYLASKSAAAISDAKYQSGVEASTALQTGHIEAWDVLSDALRTSKRYLLQAESEVEENTVKAAALDRVLGAKTAEIDLQTDYNVSSAEIQGARKADTTRRAGWREDLLAERESYNTLWSTQYAMMDEMFGSSSSSSSSGTDWGKVASGSASVAKGITGVYKSGSDAGWWGSSSSKWSAGSSLLDFGSSVNSTDLQFYSSFLN